MVADGLWWSVPFFGRKWSATGLYPQCDWALICSKSLNMGLEGLSSNSISVWLCGFKSSRSCITRMPPLVKLCMFVMCTWWRTLPIWSCLYAYIPAYILLQRCLFFKSVLGYIVTNDTYMYENTYHTDSMQLFLSLPVFESWINHFQKFHLITSVWKVPLQTLKYNHSVYSMFIG